jgi:hypothetical protein
MSIQGLKINGVTKSLDDGAPLILGTVSGLNLCQTGQFIYSSGNGASSGSGTVNISKLLPPAAGTDVYGYSAGIVDSQQSGLSALSGVSASGSTSTGAGSFRNFDLASYSNSHPFMVGLLGDGTTHGYYGLKLNNVTKSNLVPAAEDAGGTFRKVERQKVTNGSGVTGNMYVSRWEGVVVLNMNSVAFTAVNGNTVLGTVPSGWRPPFTVTINLSPHNGSRFYKAFVTSAGAITLYNTVAGTNISNAWGCGVWGTTATASTTALYSTPGLKMNGVTKNILQYTANHYNPQFGTGVNASGVTGTCNVWRYGNFVWGSAFEFNPNQSTLMSNVLLFTLPVGFRPKETTYSTGYISMPTSSSIAMVRSYARIDTNGEVRCWANGSSNSTSCTLCFYFHAA